MNGTTPSKSSDQLTRQIVISDVNRSNSVNASNSMLANSYSAFPNDTTQNSNDNQTTRLVDKKKLLQLCKEVDPLLQLDDDLEELVLATIDDFIDSLASKACVVTTSRKSTCLEAKDVQFVLERYYGISVPGYGSDDFKYMRKPTTSEANKQRLNMIKKAKQN